MACEQRQGNLVSFAAIGHFSGQEGADKIACASFSSILQFFLKSWELRSQRHWQFVEQWQGLLAVTLEQKGSLLWQSLARYGFQDYTTIGATDHLIRSLEKELQKKKWLKQHTVEAFFKASGFQQMDSAVIDALVWIISELFLQFSATVRFWEYSEL